MRAFIAIDIPEQIKENIIRFIDNCREIIPRSSGTLVKYVEKENLHITLKFLGETDSSRIDAFSMRLQTIKSNPPEILIHKTGGFPNIFFPKVIWAGIEENEILKSLFMKIEEYSINLGFEKENRDFHPHLTLARVKGNPDKELLSFLKESINLDFGSFKADEIRLYESKLTGNGPVYTVIKSIVLR
jgi:RNA 2',3'-cyclic 3'-phosphodiesterase